MRSWIKWAECNGGVRARQRLTWENCVKTDLALVGGEWRTTMKDGESGERQ